MTPEARTIEFLHGDNREILPLLPDNLVDTVITDPPYGLKFMGKKWDYDVPTKEQFAEMLRVAKPGAIMLCFGGTRTYHRMAVNIEDAGWEIRDCIMWVYGSGFPKSMDISKAMDKAAGAEREVVGTCKQQGAKFKLTQQLIDNGGFNNPQREEFEITAPSTDLAKLWNGWGTALKPAVEIISVAQKPLTIEWLCGILAQKIRESICQLRLHAKTVEKSFLLSQSGLDVVQLDSALWDAAEKSNTPADLLGLMGMLLSKSVIPLTLSIGLSWLSTLADICSKQSMFTIETETSLTIDLKTLNSFPYLNTPEFLIQAATKRNGTGFNVELVESIFYAAKAKLNCIQGVSVPGSAISKDLISFPDGIAPNARPICVAMKPLDGTFAQNAEKWGVAGLWIEGGRVGFPDGDDAYDKGIKRAETPRANIKGGRLCEYDGRTELIPSGMQPTGRFPANLIHDGSEEVVALFPDTQKSKGQYVRKTGDSQFLGKMGTGETNEPDGLCDSGSAARFFYAAKASKAERNGSKHPTVKPLALMEYLCKLTKTPTGGIVLDPFAGSGTTGEACFNTGRDFIGIENDLASFNDALLRLKRAREAVSRINRLTTGEVEIA